MATLPLCGYLDLLGCPTCDAALAIDGAALACPFGHRFPVVAGIPDLRRPDVAPPYHTRAEEAEAVREIDARAGLPWEDLVRWYLTSRHATRYTEEPSLRVRWSLDVARHAQAFVDEVDRFVADAGLSPRGGLAVDLGCGTGGALLTLARSHPRALGVNVSLAELAVARRYLDRHGLENVGLVAASAESLPLAEGRLGFVLLGDVIEHLKDPLAALRRVGRALRPGGVAFLNSPNRYSLLRPEPHVKLMWVGLLPRPLMDPYVRLRTGRRYRHVRLLGYRELERMLRGLGPELRWWVRRPDLRKDGPSSLRGVAYHLVRAGAPRLAELAYQALQSEHWVLVARREPVRPA